MRKVDLWNGERLISCLFCVLFSFISTNIFHVWYSYIIFPLFTYFSRLEEKCTLLRISGPLKSLYAKKHGLELKELMSDGPYKEKFRMDMIIWSDKVRKGQPGYFCKAACDASKQVNRSLKFLTNFTNT